MNDNIIGELYPKARSCHSIVYDPINKLLYLIGGYIEQNESTDCSFYAYDFHKKSWISLTKNIDKLEENNH